jgi:hypothetical protein
MWGNGDVRKMEVEITGNMCFVGYLLVDVHSDLQQPFAGILFCYELLFYPTFFKVFEMIVFTFSSLVLINSTCEH